MVPSNNFVWERIYSIFQLFTKGLFDGWFVVSVVSRFFVHFFGQCFVKELIVRLLKLLR